MVDSQSKPISEGLNQNGISHKRTLTKSSQVCFQAQQEIEA